MAEHGEAALCSKGPHHQQEGGAAAGGKGGGRRGSVVVRSAVKGSRRKGSVGLVKRLYLMITG
jgi:hypothetical protein